MTEERPGSRAYTERPRRIPPELTRDPQLEIGCSIFAALLLYRLITLGDDQGRLEGHPRYVRAIAFAMRDDVTGAMVETALAELIAAGFLVAYEVDGRSYLQIVRWHDMQGAWGWRAYPSRHPAPAGWTDRVKGFSRGQATADTDPTASSLHADASPTASTNDGASSLHADASPAASEVQTPYTNTLSNTNTSTSTSTNGFSQEVPLGPKPARAKKEPSKRPRRNGADAEPSPNELNALRSPDQRQAWRDAGIDDSPRWAPFRREWLALGPNFRLPPTEAQLALFREVLMEGDPPESERLGRWIGESRAETPEAAYASVLGRWHEITGGIAEREKAAAHTKRAELEAPAARVLTNGAAGDPSSLHALGEQAASSSVADNALWDAPTDA